MVMDGSVDADTAMAKLLHQVAMEASDPREGLELYRTAHEAGVAGPAQAHELLQQVATDPLLGSREVLELVMGVVGDMWEAGLSPGKGFYVKALHACREAVEPLHAVKIVSAMEREGLELTGVPFKHLICMCAGKGGNIDAAHSLMSVLESSSLLMPFHVHAYNSLISAHGKGSRFNEAIQCYVSLIANGLEPHTSTFNVLLDMCSMQGGDLDKAHHFWSEMKARGIDPDIISFQTIINVVSQQGNPTMAAAYMSEMRAQGFEPNIRAYTSLIQAHAKGGSLAGAEEAFGAMIDQGIAPNAITYTCLLKACRNAPDGLAKAWGFYDRMQSDDGIPPNLYTCSTLLNICCVHRDLRRATDVMVTIQRINGGIVQPQQVHMIAQMVSSFDFEDGAQIALEFLSRAKSAGVVPDRKLCHTILAVCKQWLAQEEEGVGARSGHVCGRARVLSQAFSAFDTATKRGLLDSTMFGLLLDVCRYEEGGGIDRAVHIRDEMFLAGVKPNPTIYNRLINLATPGSDVDYALSVLKDMCEDGVKPDEVTASTLCQVFYGEESGREPGELVKLAMGTVKASHSKSVAKSFGSKLKRAIYVKEGSLSKPKEGYICCWCGQPGGTRDSHWYQYCSQNPTKTEKRQAPNPARIATKPHAARGRKGNQPTPGGGGASSSQSIDAVDVDLLYSLFPAPVGDRETAQKTADRGRDFK